MKNNADKLLTICDALLNIKDADMAQVKQSLIEIRDKIAEVVQDSHPDDDDATADRLRLSLQHHNNSILALESVKV